jgi:[CysO sulfur-carrier protein]-S-L-cysteine hydrolase
LTDRLVLPASVRDDIITHARSKAPQEACGLVLAVDDELAILCCDNVHPTPVTKFAIHKDVLRHVVTRLGEESIRAIYHSHPATQPFPSPWDREGARYPDAYYVVVSLRDPVPEMRAFRIGRSVDPDEKLRWVLEVPLA